MAPKKTAVRWYCHDDGPQLVELFAEAYPHERWTLECFNKFIRCAKHNNIVKVAVTPSGNVIGAMLYSVRADEIVLRRVAVRKPQRLRGFGRLLVETLTGKNSLVRRDLITAEVPEKNKDGQLFLRSLRFKPGEPAIVHRMNREVRYTMEFRKRPTVNRSRLVAAMAN